MIANRVGPDGSVTGVEIDAKLGAQALADLRAEGGAKFAQIEADVLQLDTVKGAPFDFAYCRLLLMHMQDPVAALEKMASWTKPGGVIAAQEFDFGSIAIEPLCPAMGEFNRLFEGVFRAHGRNLRAGRQIPMQFEAAGLGLPDGTLAEAKFIPLKDMAAMLVGVYQVDCSLRPPNSAWPIRSAPSLQGRHGGGRRGRALLLPDPHSDRRLEAPCITRTRACRSNLPLLLAGHRVATYITAEPRRMSRRIAEILGTDAYALREVAGCRFRARTVCQKERS